MLTPFAALLLAAQPYVAASFEFVPQTRLEAGLRSLLGVYALPEWKSVAIRSVVPMRNG